LVTDKPSPITVKLAQTMVDLEKNEAGINYISSELNGHNVTKEHLKNIVTDRQAPITQHAKDNIYQNLHQKQEQGVPVLVNPVLRKNEMHDAKLGLDMTVGHDKVKLNQKEKNGLVQTKAKGVPVFVDPVLMKNEMADAKFGNKILVGNDEIEYRKRHPSFVQVNNPVDNPPFNNWSVNQPSVPHAVGYKGFQDFGQNILVDGHRVRY